MKGAVVISTLSLYAFHLLEIVISSDVAQRGTSFRDEVGLMIGDAIHGSVDRFVAYGKAKFGQQIYFSSLDTFRI